MSKDNSTLNFPQEGFSARSRNLIRERLERIPGQWVSAWDLAQVAIEYKRPIWELRHKDGLTIENKTVRVRGKVHGYYRIPRYPGEEAPPLPEKPIAAGKTEGPKAVVPTPAKKEPAKETVHGQIDLFRDCRRWLDPEMAGRGR